MFVISVLWTAFFLINFNVAMMIPLLPFIERDMSLSPFQAGAVLAAFPIVALISNLLLGPFIDRIGRKKFIVTGATACGVLFILTAASQNAVEIALGRGVTGIFMPMVGASVFAAIADYVPIKRRARVTGYVTTAAPIAFLLSMSIGIWLGGLLAWQLPILVLAAVALGLAAAALTLPPTPSDALTEHPVTIRTYRHRLLSLSPDTGTRLLLLSYLCWSAAVYIFLGLYPSWLVEHGLAGHGAGTIGTVLFIGEVGGLLGAFFSSRLVEMFRHPMALCAVAAIGIAAVVIVVPLGHGLLAFQAIAYMAFAFGRDLMLALILGGAMLLVVAAQRGSLNAILNVIYQTGGSLGGMASAWLYALHPSFAANGLVAGCLFAAAGLMLWCITHLTTSRTAASQP
jgi:predicted MFS family arabinose efflux permease